MQGPDMFPGTTCKPSAQGGFTLVELIMVIVIVGVMAATLVIFFKPAMDAYLGVGRRANLTDLADTAMRTMVRDIRRSVPNSIRPFGTACMEMVPTSAGGGYRTQPDTVADATAAPSAPLDTDNPVTSFDVMTPLAVSPAVGDWVVIDNHNSDDVYTGANRAAISSVSAPPAPVAPATLSLGVSRITLTAAKQFIPGYRGGRFGVVPNNQNAVFYVCVGGGLDAQGNGTGFLYRFSNYGFNPSAPTTCPTAVSTTPVLASRIESCKFVYSPDFGATQQSGYAQIQLKLTEGGESIALTYGAHVDNVP